MSKKRMNKLLVSASLAFLTAFARVATVNGQSTPQSVRGSGPPVITINKVTELANAGDQRRFQVQWVTQKPDLTTVLKFGVNLEVKFTGGLTQAAAQKGVSTATSSILTFTGLPANARPISFKATVSPTFTTPES